VASIAASVPFWPTQKPYDEAAAQKRLAGDQAQLLARGKYLAVVADCAACHQSPDGTPFAGGLPIATPFGTLHGTNITPDPDTGIGKYTSKQFFHALVDGVRADGQNLYPAMPYTSYHALSQADADALYAYIMQQPAVKRPNPAMELPFPFNQRWSLAYWKLLNGAVPMPANLPIGTHPLESGDALVRGAYLTNVLGHCMECHTPRNVIGGLKLGRAYQGAMLGDIQAPSLTPQALAERGWTDADLRTFLQTGIAPQGTMTLEMYPVLLHSSQYMTERDIAAIQHFLTRDTLPTQAQMPPPAALDNAVRVRGKAAYTNLCAGCHGYQGEGKAHIAPPLVTNTSLRLTNPANLLHVLTQGVAEQFHPDGEVMQSMPGYAGVVSDQELADLANTLRADWGGQPPKITAADVKRAAGR